MKPLAQDYTVIAKSPERYLFCFEPGIVKLPSGRLLVTFPYLSPLRRRPEGCEPPIKVPQMNLLVSDDYGASWRPQTTFNRLIGKAFVFGGKLYLINYRHEKRDIVIARSDNEGESWTPESKLFEGAWWNCPTGHAICNGHLYWALGRINDTGRETMAIAADLSRDILDPASWRVSNALPFPGIPPVLARDGKLKKGQWLEPNVVEVKGRIYALSVVKIFSEDGSQTSGMTAVCEVSDKGGKLDYRFVQYYPMPGGQLKFGIIYDEVSGLYWRTMNLPASVSGQDWGDYGPGDRRMLCLSYALDALNWMTAGCVVITPNAWEGFQYAAPMVDGNDLLIVSRTSLNEENQHDANMITLHRVRDFRSLIIDNFYPGFASSSQVKMCADGTATLNYERIAAGKR